MDRRSFLSRLGIGAAATVTTQLWLPPVSTALAQPERRVFVPPRGGWPALGGYPTFTGDITKLFTTDMPTSAEDVANWWAGELNAVTTDGGYFVPADIADELMRVLQEDAALKKIVPSIYATPRNFTLTGVWG